MDTQDFEKTWLELSTERAALINKRTDLENDLAEIRTKLSHLEEVLNHLGPLANLTGDIVGLGLTDAIRHILDDESDKLSAQEIRQRLSDGGLDLGQLTAPMASIYKVLSRLEESQEIEREKDGQRVFWKWKRSSPISDEDIPF